MTPGTRLMGAWGMLHLSAAVVVLAGGGALLGWTLVQEMAR